VADFANMCMLLPGFGVTRGLPNGRITGRFKVTWIVVGYEGAARSIWDKACQVYLHMMAKSATGFCSEGCMSYCQFSSCIISVVQ